jgi:hypothetical protein
VSFAIAALSLAVLGAAGPARLSAPAPAAAVQPEIRTPEGIRLRFPSGFVPRTEETRDGTSYVAIRGKELVGASIREADVDCAAAARQAPGVERFDTAGGLAACALPAAAADGHSLAVIVVAVDRLAVTAMALAAPGRAAELARAFADDIRVEGRAKAVAGKTGQRLVAADPRLVGCWRFESAGGLSAPLQPTVISASSQRRCFAADGTFTTDDVDMYSTPSGLVDRRSSATGVWSVLDGTLFLVDEDGGKRAERLEWRGAAPVLDGRLWEPDGVE